MSDTDDQNTPPQGPNPGDQSPSANPTALEVDIQPVPADGNQVTAEGSEAEVVPPEEGQPNPEPAEGSEFEPVDDDGQPRHDESGEDSE